MGMKGGNFKVCDEAKPVRKARRSLAAEMEVMTGIAAARSVRVSEESNTGRPKQTGPAETRLPHPPLAIIQAG